MATHCIGSIRNGDGGPRLLALLLDQTGVATELLITLSSADERRSDTVGISHHCPVLEKGNACRSLAYRHRNGPEFLGHCDGTTAFE